MGSSVRHIESFEYDDKMLSQEMTFAKYKKFAKENFQNLVRYDFSNIDFLKWIFRHYSFNLPSEIDEYFININAAPFLWASKIPFIKSLEDAIFSEKSSDFSSNYPEIKKFYLQWVTQKDAKEKEYYALYTINLIEHSHDENNLLQNIFYAIILTYDSKIYSPDKAILLFDESKKLLDEMNLDQDIKNQIMYLLFLFSGFVYLKTGDTEQANQMFNNASKFKRNGISALLYETITLKRMQQNGMALDIISRIIDFDKKRMMYAFKINSLNLFSYFLQTAFIYNVFAENEFADMLFDMKPFFISDKKEFDVLCGKLIDSLENLSTYEEVLTFDADIKREIEFIKKFIEHYRLSVNGLILFTKSMLLQKFNDLIDLVLEKTNEKFDKLIENNLFLYKKQIDKGLRSKQLLKEAAEKRKAEIKSHMDFEIKSIEEAHKNKVAQIEAVVEHLSDDSKFDPSKAFSSSMLINIIISLVVFIIGGFADGFMGSDSVGNDTFFSTMLGGIKWGGIIFLLGTIVAFFSSISAIWERANKKQKLIREISVRKKIKEKTIKEIKRDYSEKIEAFEDQLRRKEKSLDRDIESLEKDREMKANQLREENFKVVEKYKDKLIKIKLA